MQHSADADIGNIVARSKDLAGDIAPRRRSTDDSVFPGGFRLRAHLHIHEVADGLVPFHRHVEVLSADELGVRHYLSRHARGRNHAVVDSQPFNRCVEYSSRALDQDAACFGGGIAQRLGAGGDTRAARSASLIASCGGVSHAHHHLCDGEIELFSDHLSNRHFQPVPHIHLSEERFGRPIRQDCDPRVQPIGWRKLG